LRLEILKTRWEHGESLSLSRGNRSGIATSPATTGLATLKFIFLVIFAATLSASFASARAADIPQPLVIWNFDHSLVNSLGGKYSVFHGGPSWARTYLEPAAGSRTPGHSLRITVHRAAQGFCGTWFNFYSPRAVPEQYLDASGYKYLSFRVKGVKGGEDFDITLEDATWRQHEDTNPTRPLSAYLPDGASTAWREVLIPLSDFVGLDPSRLYNLVIVFNKPGDYRLEVDDIAFTNGLDDPTKMQPGTLSPANKESVSSNGRGLWVWKTAELLDPSNTGGLDRFFGFCAAQSVNQVFLSVEFQKQPGESKDPLVLKNAAEIRAFLERAHSVGMEVGALAGTPEWATEGRHSEALGVIDAVAAFNAAGPAPQRFDGVHFDVEPYSLVGYADPQFRPQLFKEFLEMVEQCRDRAHSDGGMTFRCDVPAWFYTDDPARRQELLVDFHGAVKTVGEHLTDLLDTVTIMDYRNEADGAGGVILFGVPSLAYAAARGKKIQVGIETSLEPDRTIYFVCGLPTEEFAKRLSNSQLRNDLYSGHYRLATFADGTNIHVGLTAPEDLDGDVRAEFEKAVSKVALEFGASSDPKRFPPGKILAQAQSALRHDPELTGFEPFNITDPATGRSIAGFKVVRHMPPGVTFHGLGREVFEEETRSVMEWLSPYASFQGLAIHYYGSFRELMEGRVALTGGR
jgi:Carbohydrate binding domain 30